MSQTRKGSLAEAFINVAIGFSINFVANLIILPAVGLQGLTLERNLYIGLAFTAVSVARTYVIRRWFNSLIERAAVRLSK